LPLVENCLAGEAENRKFAIATLQRIRFEDPASIEALLLGLDRLSPLELPVAIDALLRDNSSETDQRLLDRLRQIDTAKTLNVDNSLSRLRGRDPNVVAKWKDTLDSLQRTPDTIAAEVERWLNELPDGDARQGYHVFRSDRAACSACHQIGYVGGNVGPILSQIGRSRTRRDLLEAIVFPNARLEQSYRSTKIRTTDGEVFNGLIVEETSEIVTLQLAADRRVDIAVSNIEAREASQVSIMPTGLDQQLTKQELADLVAFLENAK
jgi:putative heme-binding domain-containing protein